MSMLPILTVLGSLQIFACTVTRFERVNPAIQPMPCICTGDVLTYECDTVGPGTTMWTGTGFSDCPTQDNQILLPHILFMTETASGECNGGSVLAQGIEVTDGQCYRSQLNITAGPHFNNTEVICVYIATNGTQRMIGSSTIHISDPPEQSVIILMDANSTHLTFSVLSPVIPYCSRTSYSIVASNCGSCPESTKSATIVCNNFTTSVETNICNLIVGAVFCGSVLGERTSFLADLRVPDAPAIESKPVYLQIPERGILAELITSFNVADIFNVSNTITGSAISYTITYSDSTSGENCRAPITIPSTLCVNGTCSHIFDVLSPSDCSSSTNITTTVFASNILGNGPPSNITTPGVNDFVLVNFNSSTRRLNCTFLNLLSDDLKHCTANITYGTNCDQQLGSYSNTSTGDYVTTPSLELMSDITEYCYLVVASSGNTTAAVRGKFVFVQTFHSDSGDRTRMIVAIIIPTVVVTLLIVSVIIAAVYGWRCYFQIVHYTIEMTIKNDFESLIQALEVFQELNVNINGFNTHFHHKDFRRKDEDSSEYSIYYVKCRCPTDKYLRRIEANLNNRFVPPEKVKVMGINSAAGRSNIITIKFPVRDEAGSLLQALKYLSEELSIELLVVNTRSASCETAGYSKNYVKFSCSRARKRKIIKELVDKKGVRDIKYVLVKVEEHPKAHKQELDVYVENSPGTLANTLSVFNDLGMNITRINKLIQSNTDHERAFRNILVKCYCDQDLKESLKNKLEEYHAQDINVRELTDSELSETDNYNCEVTYSVWDEKGSLLESLTPFQELGINIAAINPSDNGNHTIVYQRNRVEFVSTDERTAQLIEQIQSTRCAFVTRPDPPTQVPPPHTDEETKF